MTEYTHYAINGCLCDYASRFSWRWFLNSNVLNVRINRQRWLQRPSNGYVSRGEPWSVMCRLSALACLARLAPVTYVTIYDRPLVFLAGLSYVGRNARCPPDNAWSWYTLRVVLADHGTCFVFRGGLASTTSTATRPVLSCTTWLFCFLCRKRCVVIHNIFDIWGVFSGWLIT